MRCVRAWLGNEGFQKHLLPSFDHASACAAADAFEDTDLAIRAFRAGATKTDLGARYLAMYGVLQAAFVQMNALRRLHEACGLGRFELSAAMERLRAVRNEGFGHPAPTPKGRDAKATFVGRYGIEVGRLSLYQVYIDHETTITDIDLHALLHNFRADVIQKLKMVAEHMRKQEISMRQNIAMCGPLSVLLPDVWRYHLQKVRCAPHEADPAKRLLGPISLSYLGKALVVVEDGVQARLGGTAKINAIGHGKACIERLRVLLESCAAGEDVSLDVEAFCEILDRDFHEIEQFLVETDRRLGSNT
jgi:hypothetical protein